MYTLSCTDFRSYSFWHRQTRRSVLDRQLRMKKSLLRKVKRSGMKYGVETSLRKLWLPCGRCCNPVVILDQPRTSAPTSESMGLLADWWDVHWVLVILSGFVGKNRSCKVGGTAWFQYCCCCYALFRRTRASYCLKGVCKSIRCNRSPPMLFQNHWMLNVKSVG